MISNDKINITRASDINQWQALINAFVFLSIAPFKADSNAERTGLSKSLRYFPVVGLSFGLILVTAVFLMNKYLSPSLAGISLTILLFVLSRGMHFDGVADTADGLLGGWTKQEALKIMRDSSIGAFGAAAVVLVLLTKYSLLNLVVPIKNGLPIVLLLPAMSRWSAVYAAYFFKPARLEGMAKRLVENIGLLDFLIACGIILTATLILLPPVKSLIIIGWMFLTTVLVCIGLTRKIGGITGDVLGALIEIEEVLILAGWLIIL